jgi:hypothetical protein
MHFQCSLSCSQQQATEFNPLHKLTQYFSKIHFNIIFPSTPASPKVAPFFEIWRPKLCTCLSPSHANTCPPPQISPFLVEYNQFHGSQPFLKADSYWSGNPLLLCDAEVLKRQHLDHFRSQINTIHALIHCFRKMLFNVILSSTPGSSCKEDK